MSVRHIGALTIRSHSFLGGACQGGCVGRDGMCREAYAEAFIAGYPAARLCKQCAAVWSRLWREMTGSEPS